MRTIMGLVEPGYFLMERGMLFGIKERAERAAGIPANTTAAAGWGAAVLIVALLGLVATLVLGRWPHKLLILPVGAALWVATLFFGYPSPILAAVPALAILGALVWTYWPPPPPQPAARQAAT